MHRFFADEAGIQNGTARLNEEDSRHALRVLRLEVGDEVELVCEPTHYLAGIAVIEDGVVTVAIRGELRPTEAKTQVTLYQGLPKADKMELIAQKTTELGVYAIRPVAMERCVVKLEGKDASKKTERWQKIAASAAEQSGRGMVPRVVTLASYGEALNRAAQADLAILFYENEHATTLRMALESVPHKTVALLSGPEGGLEEREVEQASAAGLKVCTLGSRILRCETAPLCGLSAVMYAAGEF